MVMVIVVKVFGTFLKKLDKRLGKQEIKEKNPFLYDPSAPISSLGSIRVALESFS